MWKAFLELDALGWLESRTKPKMIAVQADGCAPIVKAFQAGRSSCDFWENAHTIATGLCVPLSFADQLILKNIRESNGTAISVSDSEIMASRQQLAQKEGIFSCPEGAATLAGLTKLFNQGIIQRDETIVIFNTGSGLKYLNC
jgi:threonine synthase